MSGAQEKVYTLLKDYLEKYKRDGFMGFEEWCKSKVSTYEEVELVNRINHEVLYIADKLFR